MGYLKLGCVVLAMNLFACGKNLPTEIRSPEPNQTKLGYLQGDFKTTDNKVINLDGAKSKPVVLIFSTDTCLVCRAETTHLVQRFKSQGVPKNIELYTILIGVYLEDAQDFKDDLQVSWSVGVQSGDQLFRSLCPQRKVPCVIVQTPSAGVVYQHEGEVPVEELEKHTGVWQ
jgi:hypothetical protein